MYCTILVNNDMFDMSHDFGCHGSHFGWKLCVTIVTKILYYLVVWHNFNTECTPLCDTSLESRGR